MIVPPRMHDEIPAPLSRLPSGSVEVIADLTLRVGGGTVVVNGGDGRDELRIEFESSDLAEIRDGSPSPPWRLISETLRLTGQPVILVMDQTPILRLHRERTLLSRILRIGFGVSVLNLSGCWRLLRGTR